MHCPPVHLVAWARVCVPCPWEGDASTRRMRLRWGKGVDPWAEGGGRQQPRLFPFPIIPADCAPSPPPAAAANSLRIASAHPLSSSQPHRHWPSDRAVRLLPIWRARLRPATANFSICAIAADHTSSTQSLLGAHDSHSVACTVALASRLAGFPRLSHGPSRVAARRDRPRVRIAGAGRSTLAIVRLAHRGSTRGEVRALNYSLHTPTRKTRAGAHGTARLTIIGAHCGCSSGGLRTSPRPTQPNTSPTPNTVQACYCTSRQVHPALTLLETCIYLLPGPR